jgi:CRISPR system Cascade subunit CasB
MNTNHHVDFVKLLRGFAGQKDRQALAVLRRSLSQRPGEDLAPYRYIGALLPDHDPRSERIHCLVAGLFALAPSEDRTDSEDNAAPRQWWSLGRTLAEHCKQEPHVRNGVERRLAALLNAHTDDMAEHLRHLVTLLGPAAARINWLMLLEQLHAWDSMDRWVQRRWAKDFWGSLPLAD